MWEVEIEKHPGAGTNHPTCDISATFVSFRSCHNHIQPDSGARTNHPTRCIRVTSGYFRSDSEIYRSTPGNTATVRAVSIQWNGLLEWTTGMPFDLKLNHKTPIIEPIMVWDCVSRVPTASTDIK